MEMIDGRDNHQIWGNQYSRPVSGIFAIQEKISKETSDNLRITLTDDAEGRVAKRFTGSREAYELYLKGRYYWNKRMSSSGTESPRSFRAIMRRVDGGAEFVGEQIVGMQAGVFFASANAELNRDPRTINYGSRILT
jgi:hypothetical protein